MLVPPPPPEVTVFRMVLVTTDIFAEFQVSANCARTHKPPTERTADDDDDEGETNQPNNDRSRERETTKLLSSEVASFLPDAAKVSEGSVPAKTESTECLRSYPPVAKAEAEAG